MIRERVETETPALPRCVVSARGCECLHSSHKGGHLTVKPSVSPPILNTLVLRAELLETELDDTNTSGNAKGLLDFFALGMVLLFNKAANFGRVSPGKSQAHSML